MVNRKCAKISSEFLVLFLIGIRRANLAPNKKIIVFFYSYRGLQKIEYGRRIITFNLILAKSQTLRTEDPIYWG